MSSPASRKAPPEDSAHPLPNLTQRQLTESLLHDQWAQAVDFRDIDPDITFTAATAQECRYILSQMGPLAERKVLDLGCGYGESAVYFAKQGAQVWACDISPGCIDVTQQLAKRHGVSVNTSVSPSENLPYPDASFDFIFANGVLHHVDIPATLPEIRRVLKPGGQGFFIEPLPYNPIINVYRMIAKDVRTPDEKPLGRKDVQTIRDAFPDTRVEGFWFFTLGLFLYFYLIERANPNKERYWKKVLYQADRYTGIFGFLKKLDDALLPRLRFLAPLCWNMVIHIRKEH